jgi:hypothetical protein
MRLSSLLVLAALAACAEDMTPFEADVQLLPEDAAPLPQTMNLQLTDPMSPGLPFTFQITGAQPSASLRIVRSNGVVGAGGCPPQLGGACLDITPGTSGYVILPPTLQASRSGSAQWTGTLPTNVPIGARFAFQVIDIPNGLGTNPEVRIINGDTDGDGCLDSIDPHPNSATLDSDLDGYGNDCDCGINDPATYPGAPETCDGLDNDCDGQLGAPEIDVDGDDYAPCNGDCNDLVATAYPGAPETCDGADSDCNPATGLSYRTLGGPGIGGAGVSYNAIFEITDTIRIEDVRWRGRSYSPANYAHELNVYESTSLNGTFQRVATFPPAVNLSPTTPYAWFLHEDVNLLLEAGKFYVFEMHGFDNDPQPFRQISAAPFPQQAPWGLHVGGWSASVQPGTSYTLPNSITEQNLFDFIVSGETDGDQDGFFACEECDDGDVTVQQVFPVCPI